MVQSHSTGTLKVTSCKLTNTREAVPCGYDSITYASTYTAWEEVVHLSAEECRAVAAIGALQVDEMHFSVKARGMTSFTYYKHGQVTADGDCKVESFKDRGQFFSSHYLRVSATLVVERWEIPYDPFLTYTVLDPIGLKVRTGDGFAHDGIKGSFIYEAQPTEECEDTLSGIYQGPMIIHQREDTITGSYITLKNQTTAQVIGARLGKRITTCGRSCYQTQIEDLMICDIDFEGIGRDWKLLAVPFQGHFPQDAIALMSQLGYTSLARSVDNNAIMKAIREDLCKVERKTLYNKLQAAASGNPYAFMDHFGAGVQLVKAGSVAYAITCEKIQAVRASYTNCTMEIPIRYRNQTWFVDPITYVMQRQPTVVPCSASLPIRWRLNGNWYCSTPAITSCSAPTQLQTSVEPHEVQEDWLFGAGDESQIYSKEEQAEHRRAVAESLSRGPIANTMAHRMGGTMRYDNGGNPIIGSPLSASDVEELYYKMGNRYFLFFSWFGAFWNIFIGVCFALTMTKMLLGMLMRMIVMYRMEGCGLWVIVAAWESLFSVFGLPVRTARLIFQAGGQLEEAAAGGSPRRHGRGRPSPQHKHAPQVEEDEEGYVRLMPAARSVAFQNLARAMGTMMRRDRIPHLPPPNIPAPAIPEAEEGRIVTRSESRRQTSDRPPRYEHSPHTFPVLRHEDETEETLQVITTDADTQVGPGITATTYPNLPAQF